MAELDIKNFFSLAGTKIKLAEQVRDYYGKELAPDFNSFDFWWIDENKVSRILASFLDPNGRHNQGDVYLTHFLKKFDLSFFHLKEHEKVKVQCEYSTDERRRIDIIIFKNNFKQAIAIENKIHVETEDQHNQIKDYINFLKGKTGEFCLIYLSPKDKELSNASITPDDKEKYIEEKKLILLNYEEEMIDCINDFYNLTQNTRVRAFLKDFEKTLRKKYMGEKNINTQEIISNFIIEDVKNLEISFSVFNSLREVKRTLKESFDDQIKEIAEKLKLGFEKPNKTTTLLRPTNWTKHSIAFSYEAGGIIYGIKRNEVDNNNSKFSESEINDKLKSENYKDFNVSSWWSMWQFFYENIENNEEFWVAIKNGDAKKRATEFIELIINNFNNDKY